MRIKVLLVYPAFPDTFWSFKHALQFVGAKSAYPPLGLLTVAALLPQAWDKRLVDANVRALRAADLAWADYVFISAMTVQRSAAARIIDQCNTAGVPVVAGGPLFTMEPEAFGGVDHFVLNEGELTLPPFLADLARGEPRHVNRSAEYPDMALSPPPRWELLNLDDYASMSIQFSRGCPFACDFCNVTALLGRKPRHKWAAQVIAELDALYSAGWRGPVLFVDDNLIGDKRYLKQALLPALIDWRNGKQGFSFSTEVSINVAADAELVRLLVEAGFNKVFIGIETPTDEGLAECGKSQNLRRDVIADTKRLQRAGLAVHGGFIVGFDSDGADIFQRQFDFIQRSGIVLAMIGMLQAPPGTALYARLAREGRLLGAISGDNINGGTNIVPRMGLDVLQRGYSALFAKLYAPEHYCARVKTFLRAYTHHGAPIAASWRGRSRIVLRAVYRLGLLYPARAHFWDLLWWTLRHRPGLIAEAIALAIYGYHFDQVRQQLRA